MARGGPPHAAVDPIADRRGRFHRRDCGGQGDRYRSRDFAVDLTTWRNNPVHRQRRKRRNIPLPPGSALDLIATIEAYRWEAALRLITLEFGSASEAGIGEALHVGFDQFLQAIPITILIRRRIKTPRGSPSQSRLFGYADARRTTNGACKYYFRTADFFSGAASCDEPLSVG